MTCRILFIMEKYARKSMILQERIPIICWKNWRNRYHGCSLMEFPEIRSLKTEIKKPWAPVGLPLNTVSVEITRSRHLVYLSIGSNIGDKRAYLDQAVTELDEHPMIFVKKVSDYFVTKPYGGVEQDDFLNGCVELETVLEPEGNF